VRGLASLAWSCSWFTNGDKDNSDKDNNNKDDGDKDDDDKGVECSEKES
jgi:hypothetical protein